MIVTRFCPSNTGTVHSGNIRSALHSYLFAKSHGGKFIFRVEDTDENRCVAGSEEIIIDSLKWLGITPDNIDSYWHQSERLHLYRELVEQWVQEGKSYRCFCSQERLEQLRNTQETSGTKIGYDGHCSNLSLEYQELHKDEAHVIRFKIPKNRVLSWNDLVRGTIEINTNELNDFVITKTNLGATYHISNCYDDACSNVTHVLRGSEWISSTGFHILLYEAMNKPCPTFGHLNLICGKDKKKLSKRNGDCSFTTYKERGFLPEAVFNFLGCLGWSNGTNDELFPREALITKFKDGTFIKHDVVLDEDKLSWMNTHYIRNAADITSFVNFINETNNLDLTEVEVRPLVEMMREKSSSLVDWNNAVAPLVNKEYEISEKANSMINKKLLTALLREIAESSLEASYQWQELCDRVKDITDAPIKDITMTLRCAITGQNVGGSLWHIADYLGPQEIIRRINKYFESK